MPDLNELREYFINPNDAESAQDLAIIMAQAMFFLAQMYEGKATEADLVQIETDTPSRLTDVVRELLRRELGTMKFDAKFMGQIHPQGNKISIISKAIAGFLNNNTVYREVSPVETEMEIEVTERIAQWFGYEPEKMSGNITLGGSDANLEALWVAREKVKTLHPEATKYYVFVSKMCHYSVDKAASILGDNIEIVWVNTLGFKTDTNHLEQLLAEKSAEAGSAIMAIIGLAGETETGDVDDLQTMAQLSQEYQTHFHVDAAYGGPFILSKQAELFAGIDQSDSITIDPHKMMYTTYSAGMVLFKDANDHHLIEKIMKERARYLFEMKKSDPTKYEELVTEEEKGERHLGSGRIGGSMGSDGAIMTWTTLELLGEDGLRELLNHTLDLTDHAYQRVIQSDVLIPLNTPELNTLLIGLNLELFADNYPDVIKQMKQATKDSGYYISLNDEVDHGRPALRLVPMHPHTELAEVDQLITILEETARVNIA